MVILLLAWFPVVIGIARNIHYKMISPIGAFVGVVLGVLLVYSALLRSYKRAKKGIFIDRMARTEQKIIFGILCPICFMIAICIAGIKIIYFPDIDLSKEVNSGLLMFLFVFCGIGSAGIYILERRYGKKFYIGKRKE